jgi:hypothetical protein
VRPLDYNFAGILPSAFTEQKMAMLTSVLPTNNAIEVNIALKGLQEGKDPKHLLVNE